MGEGSEQPTNAFYSIKNTNITSGSVVLKLGDNHIWCDASGSLRMSTTNPTSDTGGLVITSS